MEMDALTTQMVNVLVHENINFLAIDFDYTLIDIHMGSHYTGTFNDLLGTFRPILVNLIICAMRMNIAVSVVTFQTQTKLIKRALKAVFPSDIAERILLRGNDKTWDFQGVGFKGGKHKHMASAAAEIYANPCSYRLQPNSPCITRATTLLLDDDLDNIKAAMTHHVRALWLDPSKPSQESIFDLIMSLRKE